MTLYFLVLDRFAPSTDDASVQAYVINVSSYINGTVDKVYVHENQLVEKDAPLFTLDPKEYELALAAAQNNLILTIQQGKENAQKVAEAQENLNSAKAAFEYHKTHHDSFTALLAQGAISKDLFDKDLALLTKSQDAVVEAEKALTQAEQVVGPSINGVNIHVIQAQNAIDSQKLNLARTTVYASKTGYVTNLQLQKGSFVTQFKNAITLIDKENFWVQANLKENNLSRVKIGQPVLVTINSYPGKIFKGSVESVSWGVQNASAGNGAPLPTIEKTNNWVNLAQRFPVKIKVDLPGNFPLRVGTTAIITVQTTSNFFIRGLADGSQWIRAHAQFFY
jgi:multidrug resistance efflux pump